MASLNFFPKPFQLLLFSQPCPASGDTSVFLQYVRDAEDVIIDSVAVARTASGHAKVKLETMLFTDGPQTADSTIGVLSPRESHLLPHQRAQLLQ